jgi:hypothetical protein
MVGPRTAPERPKPCRPKQRVGLACVLALLLAACGGSDPQAPPPPSQDSWQVVFKGVLSAMAARDLDALRSLLSPPGRQALDADLASFAEQLADPEKGAERLAQVRRHWPEMPDALVERVRARDLRAAWTIFMEAGNPRDVQPTQAGVQIDPARPDEVTALYRYGKGPERPVLMRRARGQWAVEGLSLGGR